MATYKLLLVCAIGMSTTHLVRSILEAAEERRIDVEIFTTSANEADHLIIHNEGIDLLLLAPQIRFLKGQFKEKFAHLGIPIRTINMQDFGTVNGAKILIQALDQIDQK